MQVINVPEYGLDKHGIYNVGSIFWNLTTPMLYEEVVRRREGLISHNGPLVVRTGHYTGRSPNDKFIVREPTTDKDIWWGKVNKAMPPENFDRLHARVLANIQGKDLYIQDCYAGADENYRVPIRIINEYSWHNLFARNMFIQINDPEKYRTFVPEFTIIDLPRFHALPEQDGTNSEAFIIVNFGKKMILIGATSYAGEIKKSVFTILNYLLPSKQVLSMHCAANVGKKGDVALFFGLSGTGKTTLSADPTRRLIGDDEHGWSDRGIFNFEGGCYAKAIRLSKKAEPEIYEITHRFGTVLENVTIDYNTRRINLDDDSLTENTRAAYTISRIPNAELSGMGDHPKNIIMLAADAFGVLPPVSKLSSEQAIYHFLSGYTAKVAGTEKGVTEPQATFSTCFGAPFMALRPSIYGNLLGEKIRKYKAVCWLVNTGWTGGAFGTGKRISIAHTRAIISSILDDKFNNVETRVDPIFGLHVPVSCDGIPPEILNPKNTWPNKDEYDEKARDLANRFRINFETADFNVGPEIKAAGPK